jgi:hypothetical protein
MIDVNTKERVNRSSSSSSSSDSVTRTASEVNEGRNRRNGHKTAMNGLRAAQFHSLKTHLQKHFNEQDVSSSQAIEGSVRQHGSQGNTPFQFLMPSGLARSQQLHMLQRFLNVPALPSFVKNEGGFVLDRVITQLGGNDWWTTLSLRIRAQRMWNTRETVDGKPHRAMMLPSMYGLGGKVRVGVFEKTIVKGVVEMKSLTRLVKKFMPASADEFGIGGGAMQSNGNAKSDLSKIYSILDGSMERRTEEERDAELANRAPTSCRITLQSKILPGHTINVDLSSGEKYQVDNGYIDGPTMMQASIMSRGRQAVHYKAGVSQILNKNLPEFESKVSSSSTENNNNNNNNNNNIKFQKPPRREGRAGISFEQQVMLWKGKRRRKKRKAALTTTLNATTTTTNNNNNFATTTSSYSALPQMPNLTFGFIAGVIGRWNLDKPKGSIKAIRRRNKNKKKGDTSMNRTMDESSILSTEDDDDYDDDNESDDYFGDHTIDISAASIYDNNENAAASAEKNSLKCELHNFLSASMHFQIGSFSRTILDLTSLDVRVDMGARQDRLTTNQLNLRDSNFGYSKQQREKEASKAQKFLTLDGLLIPDPSVVTVSLCQQILGPITFKGEIRASGSETMSALRVGAKKLIERKPLQECRDEANKELKNPEIIYGIDCPLPPALGTARLVAWYNVSRQEAFGEIRLFDM